MADLILMPNSDAYAKNLLPVSYNLGKEQVFTPTSGSGSATIGDNDFFAVYGDTSLHLFNSSLTTSAVTFELDSDFQARVNETGIYAFTFYVYVPSTMTGASFDLEINIYVNGAFSETVSVLLDPTMPGFMYDVAVRYMVSKQYNADDEIDFTYTLGQDASAPFPGGRAFLSGFKLELINQNQPYAGMFIPVAAKETGFAIYTDTGFGATSPIPQAIPAGTTVSIGNNSGTTLLSQLPSYVSNFYSASTQKLVKGTSDTMGNGLFDVLNIEIKTTVKSTVSQDVFKVLIDVGGTEGIVASETKKLVAASGTYETVFTFFSLPISSDFIANGGIPKITATSGDLSVYGTSYTITRIHKA